MKEQPSDTRVLTSVPVGCLIKHQHCIFHLQNNYRIECALGILRKYAEHSTFWGEGLFPSESHSYSG